MITVADKGKPVKSTMKHESITAQKTVAASTANHANGQGVKMWINKKISYHYPDKGFVTITPGTPCELIYNLNAVSDMNGTTRQGIRGTLSRHESTVCIKLDGRYTTIDRGSLSEQPLAPIGNPNQGNGSSQEQRTEGGADKPDTSSKLQMYLRELKGRSR